MDDATRAEMQRQDVKDNQRLFDELMEREARQEAESKATRKPVLFTRGKKRVILLIVRVHPIGFNGVVTVLQQWVCSEEIGGGWRQF